MRKLKTRLFTGLLAVMLCCTALTPAAFAYAEDPEEGTSEKPVTGRGAGTPDPGGQPNHRGRH